MKSATFRFYAELNDFLPKERRSRDVPFAFDVSPSVKDVIESFGVPHTEVDVILVDGLSVDFAHRIGNGDRVGVYPVFETFDVSPLVRLRPQPLRVTRFVLDGHLGRLARLLRIAGFDTLYNPAFSKEELVRASRDEERLLLTRDVGLLKRSELTRAYYIRSTERQDQLEEVVDRFDLRRQLRPFTRCPRCNGRLERAARADIEHLVEHGTLSSFDDFWRCDSCGQPYWKGAHQEGLNRLLERLARRDEI